MTLIHLFLVHRYKVWSVHYVSPTDDNRYQAQKMKTHGLFSDVHDEVEQFQRGAGASKPLCIGVVGINHAQTTTSYEGDRAFLTDGKRYKHPYQEAADAERRLVNGAAPSYEHFFVLRYRQ